MVSSIVPTLAGISIIVLYNKPVPNLRQHVQNWRRYENDSFVYMKNGSTKYFLSVLETFHRT